MKSVIQTGILTLLVVTLASCKKESIEKSWVISTQSIETITEIAEKKFHIGDALGGGIIFYLDSTKKHGLLAAKSDQSSAAEWAYLPPFPLTNATGTKIGKGESNTKKIVDVQGYNGYAYAAYLCVNYNYGGYTDWFLPSSKELLKLYKQRVIVNALGFSYWSSTEYGLNEALAVSFGNNGILFHTSKGTANNVRAIRAF